MVIENDPPEPGKFPDRRALWRITAWGASTTLALTTAVMITRTEVGAERLRLAFAPEAAVPARVLARAETPPPVIAKVKDPAPQGIETRRLESELRQLAADRDRLKARVASLEQNLNDMTGSIKRELALVAAIAPDKPPTVSAPSVQPATPSQPNSEPAPLSTIDRPSEPKTDAAEAKPDKPAMTKPAMNKPATTNPAMTESPRGVEVVPLPPLRVASAPEIDLTAPDDPSKPELGIDLGGARTMEILNARWAAVKANFGPLIEGMYPLAVHDRRPNTIPYRLIVGPLPNGAAAAQLCKRIAAARVACRTTRFAGERFAHDE